MSFNPLAAWTVAKLLKHLPENPTVVELGNQTFKVSDEILLKIITEFADRHSSIRVADLRSLIDKSKAEVAASTAFFYKALGFRSYASIDVNSRYGSLMMDLNRDLRTDYSYVETFDLVTNSGTGEHCFNQCAVLKNMHDLTKKGGLMLHIMPLNWVNHGFYNFNPVLYADLAAANGYEILELGFSDRRGREIQAVPKERAQRPKGDGKKHPKSPAGLIFNRVKSLFGRFQSRRRTDLSTAGDPVSNGSGNKWSGFRRMLEVTDMREFPKVLLVAVLRKKTDSPFVVPLQGKYEKAVESMEIQERYDAQIGPGPASDIRSVLAKASAAEIVSEPFPHLVIRNALDGELYERLAAEFPASEILMNGKAPGSNKKHFYPAKKVLTDPQITPLWRQFFQHHLSGDFYQEVLSVFGSSIRALYPDLEARLNKKLQELTPGIRRYDEKAEVFMDCQFAINSPVLSPSSVRGPHFDGPYTLYQGLLYFRGDADHAGGDLELYRLKQGVDPRLLSQKAVDRNLIDRFATVKYEKNTLIFFVNSKLSLHGVSFRSVTDLPRRYVYLLADLTVPLFELIDTGNTAPASVSSTQDEY